MDIKTLIEEIIENKIVNITFSNRFQKSYEYQKVNIMDFNDYYQISSYTDKQVFHDNVNEDMLSKILEDNFKCFKQMDGSTRLGDYNVRVNKKGSILRRFKEVDNSDIKLSHNRSKNYVLKNYETMEILKELKIVSQDNKIINAMYDKFKQINKYVELVDDLIKKDNPKSLKIVDFGSGKSYLTFTLYEYLVNTLNIDVEMIGIDLKESVINDNIKLAKKYKFEHLHFIHGDINDLELEDVDMMISLHACDIATDLALNKALEWKVKYIVSVPCCHNEVYQQMKSKHFSKMINYNIIKERLSALVTDTIRANVLEYKGYQTQVIEYIDSDHSLKNLMIRARFTNYKDNDALQNIENLQEEYGINQKLLELQKIGVRK